MEVEVTSGGGNDSMGRETLGQEASSVIGLGVVKTLVQRLKQIHAVATLDTNGIVKGLAQALVDVHVAHNDGRGEENNEEDQHDEVENRETDHTSLAQLGLLQRVDRRPDLATASTTLEAIHGIRGTKKHTWGAAKTE